MQKPKLFKPKKLKSKVFNGRKDRDDLYDEEWVRYRFIFLRFNPTCFSCGKPSTVVDHILAHKGNAEKFKELKNHMPLCSVCHNIITARFDRWEPPKTEEKLRWIGENRKKLGLENKIVLLKYYGRNQ